MKANQKAVDEDKLAAEKWEELFNLKSKEAGKRLADQLAENKRRLFNGIELERLNIKEIDRIKLKAQKRFSKR